MDGLGEVILRIASHAHWVRLSAWSIRDTRQPLWIFWLIPHTAGSSDIVDQSSSMILKGGTY